MAVGTGLRSPVSASPGKHRRRPPRASLKEPGQARRGIEPGGHPCDRRLLLGPRGQHLVRQVGPPLRHGHTAQPGRPPRDKAAEDLRAPSPALCARPSGQHDVVWLPEAL
jgi:hypothetical protein